MYLSYIKAINILQATSEKTCVEVSCHQHISSSIMDYMPYYVGSPIVYSIYLYSFLVAQWLII